METEVQRDESRARACITKERIIYFVFKNGIFWSTRQQL
jgi:hypothetical protein